MHNPRSIDPKSPPLQASLSTFRELADHIGPERVIWRYDPIVFSNVTGAEFHRVTYQHIAQALRGHTYRSVISIVDIYGKAKKRLRGMAEQGAELLDCEGKVFSDLMHALARIANENGMEIVSCAEKISLQPYGIRPGKCVDDEYISPM